MACPKPIIASPVFEVSSLLGQGLSQGDGTTVTTWPDQSGQGVNMPISSGTPEYLLNGWGTGVPAVRFLTGEALDIPYSTALNSTNMTLFFVIEATDITANLAVIGDAASSSFPRRVTCVIDADGHIIFTFSAPAPGNCFSAPGVIVQGGRYVISLRFSSTTGMIIRVNGVEVATSSNLVPQVSVSFPVLSRSKDDSLPYGNLFGNSMLYGWASAYRSAASDQEILDMECYLGEQFDFDFLSKWFPAGPAAHDFSPPVPATKPTIASPRGEYDARSLVLGDLAIVNTWPDVSPLGTNDLTLNQGEPRYQAVAGAGTPWSATLPAVRMDDSGPSKVNMNFVPFGTSGTPMTMFVVAEATRLLPTTGGGGMAFWGSSDAINPPVGVYLFIAPDGSVGFITGQNGAVSGVSISSPAGLVSPGDRVIITARREEFPQSFEVNSGPMILRVNGVQVDSAPISGWTDFWFGPFFHRCALPTTGGFPGSVDGEDGLVAHALAFQSAASDEEILQMEAWLSEIWGFDFLSKWLPEGTQVPVATAWVGEGEVEALKPAIVGLEIEFDARTLVLVDGNPVNPWPDTSGQGNNAQGISSPLYEATGWPPTSGPAVRMEQPGNRYFIYDGSAFIGSEFTMFFVCQALDFSNRINLMGGSSFNNRQIIEVVIKPNGSILFSMFTSETGDDVVTTAPGLVAVDDFIIITVRHSNTSGKIIRLNGTEVGASPAGVNDLTSYPNPQFNTINATFFSDDLRLVWTSGYTSAASDTEIEEMEAFLNRQFFGSPPIPPTDWTPA
jgi:hypothetical protein